jgi:hypothetical protein
MIKIGCFFSENFYSTESIETLNKYNSEIEFEKENLIFLKNYEQEILAKGMLNDIVNKKKFKKYVLLSVKVDENIVLCSIRIPPLSLHLTTFSTSIKDDEKKKEEIFNLLINYTKLKQKRMKLKVTDVILME